MATETLRPNGAGDLTQLFAVGEANNWQNVDEASPDNDTTYNRTSTASERMDLYELQDHAEGSGTINSVTVYAVCRALVAGTVKPCLRAGGSDYAPASAGTLTTSYATYSHVWAINPNTGNPWQWSEIDALQAGVIMQDDGINRVRVTQVYVVVDYTVATGAGRMMLLGVG